MAEMKKVLGRRMYLQAESNWEGQGEILLVQKREKKKKLKEGNPL